MPNPLHTLTIRLSQPDGTTYHLDLTSPDVGERRCAPTGVTLPTTLQGGPPSGVCR